MIFRWLIEVAFAVCLLLSSGYAVISSAQTAGSMPIGEPFQIQAPPELPPILVPAHNPPTVEFGSPACGLDYDKNISQERKALAAFPETPAGETPPGVGALV